MNDIEGLNLLDVETTPVIINENKINTKIMYEAELNMKFIFENSRKQINVKDAKIPFEYTIENLQNGESLNTNCDMGIKSQDFIIQDGGDISCNVDVQADTSMYRTANLNMIDSIVEDGEREEQDYSLVIYVVKRVIPYGILLRSLVVLCGIARTNGIEDRNKIYPGQKLYIPKFEKISEKAYE